MKRMIRIAPMSFKDIPAVLEIERESHIEPWSEASFAEELGRSHSHLLIARTEGESGEGEEARGERRGAKRDWDGRIIGYICFWCVADEVQILTVAVHKDFRRKGVARVLMDQALGVGWEKQAMRAVLEVRKSNTAAQLLYESLGFRVVGERPNYYDAPKESAILMELQIGNGKMT